MDNHLANFLHNITTWATHQPTISNVALVGSQARGTARPDSDIDLILLCLAPDVFLFHIAWIRLFGKVIKYRIENWGRLAVLRVFYEKGMEVEFGLTTALWAAIPVDAGTQRVVADGMHILLDRDGALERLQHVVRTNLEAKGDMHGEVH